MKFHIQVHTLAMRIFWESSSTVLRLWISSSLSSSSLDGRSKSPRYELPLSWDAVAGGRRGWGRGAGAAPFCFLSRPILRSIRTSPVLFLSLLLSVDFSFLSFRSDLSFLSFFSFLSALSLSDLLFFFFSSLSPAIVIVIIRSLL